MSKSADVFPLCQHLDSLVDELRRRIPQALGDFDEKGIHQARVTTRRLKAAIELLESTLDKDHSAPFAKVGKKLRRRLGPLRDLDVMLDHLNEIKPTSPHAPAVEWLRARLLRDRLAARDKAAKKTPAPEMLSRLGTWWAVRQDVINADDKVSTLLVKSTHLQLDAFAEHADASINMPAAASGMSESKPRPGPQADSHRDPHELRIAGKNLRYTLELSEAQGFDLPKGILGTFKRMQKFLGLWHDYVVLAERVMQASLDEDLALHDPAMQRRMLKLTDFAMTRAQRQLEGFAKLWTDKGPALAQTIRDTFPLSQPASEPQTGPGPAGSPAPSAPADDSSSSAPAA